MCSDITSFYHNQRHFIRQPFSKLTKNSTIKIKLFICLNSNINFFNAPQLACNFSDEVKIIYSVANRISPHLPSKLSTTFITSSICGS